MSLKRRRRSLDDNVFGPPAYYSSTLKGKKEVARAGSNVVWKGIQVTDSEGHRKSKDGHYHEGGPFFTVRIQPDIHYRNVELLGGTTAVGYYFYNGPVTVRFIPINYGDFLSHASPMDDIDKLADNSFLDPYGAEAISIVDPMNPNAATGTALGEILRDKRIPVPGIELWRQRTLNAKSAGSEYLNAVFGWMPLLSDVMDTAQSIRDVGIILENYRSASGTNVQREFEFPHEFTESTDLVGTSQAEAYYGGNISRFNNGASPITRRTETTTRRWFSGEFTYHAAEGKSLDDILRARTEAEKLFGTTITPDLLWELTPWSWAIDWFSNASNVVHNVGAFLQAGLVMRYGYIMEEKTIVQTYEQPAVCLAGASGGLPPSSITYSVKRRRDANPFGFGIGWEGLSPTQLAITAALGITRLR